MLARRLGYQATGISGMVTTPDWLWQYDTPGWVEINEGGKIYVCDPEETWAYGWDLFYKPYGTHLHPLHGKRCVSWINVPN